ncbi:hypothetical protein ACE7GA_23815 [Roseomonas sp. CCTCC AB2023176]|uniref:hypothetical protein n=1 Tax=Roseomonas sp. CCTCC AB2023176 TaxID=3342640 RepID=UPI0035DE8163
MSRPVLAALALVTAAAVTSPAQAAEGDSVFGNFFSRVVGSGQAQAEAPHARRAADAEMREREARDMRRAYWERERARIAQQASSRQAVASTDR